MRIAFYAPLKSPTHGTPSGDRRVAGLLMQALEHAGHRVELVSTLRTYDGDGDARRQAALREQGIAIAHQLVAQWREGPRDARPDLWFTYHVYYKAPDWLGPVATAALGIPYVIAEASYAPKRAGGPWAIGHAASADAINRAELVICPTRDDIACLEPVVAARDRIMLLPPFLDAAPFRTALNARDAHRARLAANHDLDPSVPWIVVAAMMRPADKLASYRALAAVLARLQDLSWRLIVAGDGPARAEVEAALEAAVGRRTCFLGELASGDLAPVYAAGDLCVWPAINEAYGMAMLEAQAAGLPVVSCALRGVPDIMEDGRTGLLAPPGDEAALAQLARTLLSDAPRRIAMGHAAAAFASGERSIEAAAARLGTALARVEAGRTARAAARTTAQ
jgi:glycosyltransferase involved in cell wall biosynthesis